MRGNKGEWSEVYVFLKLLADGKIYTADSNLNKIDGMYFPVSKVVREEAPGDVKEYTTGEMVDVYSDGKKQKSVSRDEFKKQSDFLLSKIRDSKGSAFPIEETQGFMDGIFCHRLSAPSSEKSDITVGITDVHTGYSPTVGFSIKSELGSSPTLLNAGKTTNFVYKVEHDNPTLMEETNKICRVVGNRERTDVRGRIENIIEGGGSLQYANTQNQVFHDNLALIDSSMDNIVAETLLYFYRDDVKNCEDMVKRLESENPLNYGNPSAYRYKFKKFLTAVALGMKPATIWDGIDEADGGYIIVAKNGDVLAYHLHNRNHFEEYLLKNTKYETPSTSRHGFGDVYSVGGEDYFNLNLQIRFK